MSRSCNSVYWHFAVSNVFGTLLSSWRTQTHTYRTRHRPHGMPARRALFLRPHAPIEAATARSPAPRRPRLRPARQHRRQEVDRRLLAARRRRRDGARAP
eukprot:5297856-Prymnesium_polylepis.1